ncbi:energy-coupling factor ABC transporter transmembrane protein [Listeria cossartiae]|uniref:energy-coupling factor ABC transporter transmembrane protein n=1 Tax=Listeria cossartiae TaxID=2838249 RepID=UPI00288089E9|nr:energy-coupling factor ABC transporter transmembrane protein [Listeria cossartiae]MDT0013380.1 energy-coupling factor ABC transporter transmembrane protein [Listeria cossartiae subsp. cayugensis]
MLTIDKYAYQNRWIAFSPSAKALFYVAVLILALTGPMLVQAILFLCMVPLTLYVVKIHFKQYLKWLLLPFSFLLFSLLSILISISKDPSSFLASISIGSFYLGISDVTITTATQVFFRSIACLAATYFFVLTVPVVQLTKVMKQIFIPKVLIELTILIYRFIFIFLEEAAAIRKAQSLRFGYHGLKNSYRSFGMLVNTLFNRVMKRYNEMVVTLDVKLYQGEFHI